LDATFHTRKSFLVRLLGAKSRTQKSSAPKNGICSSDSEDKVEVNGVVVDRGLGLKGKGKLPLSDDEAGSDEDNDYNEEENIVLEEESSSEDEPEP